MKSSRLFNHIDTPLPSKPSAYSIQQVNALIAEQLRPLKAQGTILIHCQWIRPQTNNGAGGFFTVTLADCERSEVAIPGIIWDRPVIDKLMEDAKKFGIDLCDRTARIEVFIEASIEFWLKQSKVYLKIRSLNTIGMKGLKQQEREEAIRRLQAEGLLERNRSRPWPVPCLRVAIVTKQGSAACEDTLSILKKSGYAFIPTVFHVSVQGAHAEPSLIEALSQIESRRSDFDVVLLCRGGGSELDLLAYDRFSVARAVASCSLPVITGLGHQIDHSVCDLVAYRSVETPTAAANYLVAAVHEILATAETLTQRIGTHAAKIVARAQTTVLLCTGPVIQRSLQLLHSARQETTALTHAILYEHSRKVLQQVREDILHLQTSIQARMLKSGPTAARLSMQLLLAQIESHMRRALECARHTAEHCVTRMQAFHPNRLAQLGFVYVTTGAGTVVRDPGALSVHDPLTIHFQHHDVETAIVSIKEHSNDPRPTHPRKRRNPAGKPRRSAGRA
jgi:exodeoxyribonuclease VII large subunit